MKWLVRIVGGFAGLLVIAVAILLVLGARADSNRLQASVTIHRGPEAVWPWLYEPDKLKSWVTWLKQVDRDREGPPAVGARAVWVMEDMNNGGAQMRIKSDVAAVESNRRLAVKLSVPGAFAGTAEYTLADLGGGATRLECDSRYTFDNPFAKLMTPLIISSARKKMLADMDRMRAAVESAQ
jgi:uncharacterized protein YndB with AHSA1/START domain